MGSGSKGLYSGTFGSKATPGSTDYMDSGDSFSKFIKRRKDIDTNGFYDIIAHGSPTTIQIQHNGVTIDIVLLLNFFSVIKIITEVQSDFFPVVLVNSILVLHRI